ncbi:MAG: flagellar export chaperone FlgN [Phycisphaeraceae bacterium]|nr:flagellar export chaperone FlgN [Phycisphaeraceae bacterium]
MTTTNHVHVAWAVELEMALAALIEAHEQLLDVVGKHRQAISQADPAALQQSLAAQQDLLRRIAEAEAARQALVRRIIAADRELAAADRAGSPTPRVTQLAERLRGGARDRLLELGSRLRTLIERLQSEQRSVRVAAESLATHMQGLARQIGRAFSPAGTYGPRSAHTGAPALTLDLRS